MTLDFVPEKFSDFLEPLKAIVLRQPVSISILGSYGNPNKKPTDASDLDLVFVFDTESIYEVFQLCLSDLHKVENLEVVELGVHFQYGFVVSIYYPDNPLCWVDLGVMDVNFSRNYLVNIPKTEVFGSVQSSDIGQNPLHQMNHLARKILKASVSGQSLTVDIACYRYLAWLKVYSEIQMYKNEHEAACLKIIDLFKSCKNELKVADVVKLVFNDIGIRFPEILKA